VIKRILWVLGAVVVLGVLGAGVWLATPAALLPEASAAQASTDSVQFERRDGWLVFTPPGARPSTGLIFYPGGRVSAEAYAPAGAAIAAHGYRVVIPSMPFNLAFFNADAADPIRAAYPEVMTWVIGGHSLGGAMAADYASRHPGELAGLVLWASYSASDLSGSGLDVVSIYGARETGRASFLDPANTANLPADTHYVEIPGGNHEQFGYYTGQPNDPAAGIPRDDQQAEAVSATLALLDAVATR
jgi:pimeloyl-ACP methyl ester carboxylesterase